MQDFAITASLVFLWLVCSSAWAKGLQNVKDATGSEGVSSTLALCTGSNVTCGVTEFANLRTLNFSVVRRGTQPGLAGIFRRGVFVLNELHFHCFAAVTLQPSHRLS